MNTYKNKREKLVLGAFSVLAASGGIVSYTLNDAHTSPEALSELHSAAGNESGATLDSIGSAAAHRLQRRLGMDGGVTPGIATLDRAMKERGTFLRQSITMHVQDFSNSDAPVAEWTISLAAHPELLTLRSMWGGASYVIDRNLLSEYMRRGVFGNIQERSSAVVRDVITDKKVERATNVRVARDGYDYDVDVVADALMEALQKGSDSASVDLPYGAGSVQMDVAGETLSLQLLASGLSDYSDSPPERVWNVHKAINEYVNNVVVRPGEQFSFVDMIDAPVTLQKGWKEGLGLFGGGAALTPGAGICQAATTVYRAALLAGLPITYKRNHSMFVDHYEPYGIGLDATVFPGVHDMTFLNDTSDIILIQAYTRGDDVIVNIYGVPDGRTVSLDGPYFDKTPNRAKELRPLDWDEIGWVHTVTKSDGSMITKPIYATYFKGFFRSIKEKYAGTPGIVLLREKDPADTLASAATQ